MKEQVVLQRILFEGIPTYEETQAMYYRGSGVIRKTADGSFWFKKNTFYDFSTYFNSLSVEKWRRYTFVEDVFLELEAVGKFEIDLMGHYVDNRGQIKKEWLGKFQYYMQEKKTILIPYPSYTSSSVITFQMEAKSDTEIFSANYVTQVEAGKKREPHITLVTTTFKKEKYVLRNVGILNRNLFSDPKYKDYFSWKIVDNGGTLDAKEINNQFIELIPNINAGGSGGFARGMLEASRQRKKATNVLLMDDDVEIIPESFKRVCTLLMLLRPKYQNYFISGAMLEISQHNIQHEDVGYFSPAGEHGPAKPRFDLNLWDSVVRNEVFLPEDIHQYSGWWFCCIPTTVANQNNLPLPVFVRGDDVEYSIRNHAKFISMNGICIWHEGFGNKFSGALELYQVHRNDLVLQAMHEETADVRIMERITFLFWEEMYKFNYKGAELLLESVEDYLKGPEFLTQLNGEECMKEKRAKDNKLYPVTEEIRRQIDYGRLYEYIPLSKTEKLFYDYSYNGQRFPKIFARKKAGIIPYGWGYYQQKQYMTRINYAIDPINDLYAVYERSDKEFKRLKQKFAEVMERYKRENETVTAEYRKWEKEMESERFWEGYLQ